MTDIHMFKCECDVPVGLPERIIVRIKIVYTQDYFIRNTFLINENIAHGNISIQKPFPEFHLEVFSYDQSESF